MYLINSMRLYKVTFLQGEQDYKICCNVRFKSPSDQYLFTSVFTRRQLEEGIEV